MGNLAHRRPLLTVSQQVDRLKDKGVTFDLCDETHAARFLANDNNYLRVTSCRKLYDRQEEGPNATPQVITDSLNSAGVARTKARRAKLSNLRIAQIAASLYCLNTLCASDSAMARHAERFAEVRSSYEGHIDRYRLNSSFVSFFDFLLRLVDIWVPCGT